jgi:hypothetical protein
MLGEDRVGGPVTTAEIEAVAEPLGCVVGDLIGPSSAHGYLPFRSSGLLWMATTQQRRPRARTRANQAECDTRGNGPKTHNLGGLR